MTLSEDDKNNYKKVLKIIFLFILKLYFLNLYIF